MRFLSYLIFSLCLICSCAPDAVIEANRPKANALGKMNEIIIVTDQNIWDSIVGDSLDYYFGGQYPITPRPEPLFDVRHFTAEKINVEPFLRELRTYLIVANLNDRESATTKMMMKDLGEQKFQRAISDETFTTSVGKNKWANGQILIYLFGNSHDELLKEIRENFTAISTRVKAHDSEQLSQLTYAKGENKGLSIDITERYGYNFTIPADYKVIIDDSTSQMLWLKKEEKDASFSIIFKRMKYDNIDQLSSSYIKQLRDEYGKEFTFSNEPNSFMVTNNVDLPILEYGMKKDGYYAKEFRGIWELENDFMGGPFISYLMVNEEKGELLFVDTWVFAPGKKKRDKMQQLELVIKGT